MKKTLLITLLAISSTTYSQSSGVYSSARFLRYVGGPAKVHNDYRKPYEVPGLDYTFTVTKNTVVQIANTVSIKTYGCLLCPETEVVINIMVDNAIFASSQFSGDNKAQTISGSSLAQLGPGTHTIKLVIYKNFDSADFDVQGYNEFAGNRTCISLLFFEQ